MSATQGEQPASDDPMVGATLGGFRVVRQLGVGGMGTVYLGEHAIIGSRVAIKVLHPQLAQTQELVQRFFHEARAVNVIGHENIVNIIDLNRLPPNHYYYVMEFLDGKTLQDLVASGPVPVEVAVPILSQVCDALAAAHAHGIIHRDLKPENIVLIRRGRTDNFVKVLDFGIAKLLDSSSALPQGGQQRTATGLIIGTPEFMAPEQTSASPVDARTDIYALGVLTYRVVTGQLPFAYKTIAQLLIAHQTETPKPPREVNPTVSAALSDAILKAIAKKPADRYQTADAFREALEAAVRPAEAQRSTSMPTPLPTDSRHIAPFYARVALEAGKEPTRVRCHDLSRGGVFLCAEGKLPAVFTRLTLTIEVPGAELVLKGEVVRQVTPAQAVAWHMPAGFGVQFLEVSPELKEQLARVAQGLPAMAAAAPAPEIEADDPEAAKDLELFRKRVQGDHYVVLAAPPDADIGDLRQRGRESLRVLDRLKERQLSGRQKRQLDAARERIEAAVAVLGNVRQRAEYDGSRGNYRGVGKCLAAGLSPSELDGLRKKWSPGNQRQESSARIHFISASAWESQRLTQRALEEYERALAADPLNFEFHSRYWALKRKLTGGRA